MTAVAFDVTAQPREAVVCAFCGPSATTVVTEADRYGLPTRVVQCDGCGLRFITPRMTADAYAAFYQDGYRPLIEAHHARHGVAYSLAVLEADQWRYAALLAREVAPYLPLGGTVLDIGGSTGIVGRTFLRKGPFTVTVIDPSAEELSRATGCATICGTAETVELPPADVALLCRTVDHLLDPVGVLRKIRASLLIIDAMDVDYWPEAHRYKVDHPYAFTAKTLRRLVTQTGWRIRHEWTRRHGQYLGLVCSPQE